MSRIKELEVTEDRYIDITELDKCAVIIDDGKAKVIDLHTHGEVKIIMHQGKVKRVRFEEGEDF